jgi:Putative MetA-pathway of phenol degradation
MLNKISISLLITICSFNAIAQEEKNWSADLSVSTQHQEYELVSADMQSLNFTPYYQTGNWIFSANLPWMKIDGDYFINGSAPRIVSFCSQIADASPLVIQRLINRGRITEEQITRCDQINDALGELEESQSGVGDISLSANYMLQWSSAENWWTAFGLEYKADNGDFEKGIGSGSRDTSITLGIGCQGEKWSNHLDASFTSVSATDSTYEIDDYLTISAGIAYLFWGAVTWGVDYQFEQAYLKEGSDVKYFSTYLDWAITDATTLRVTASDYEDLPEYPQTEYAVTLGFSF